MSGTLAIDLQEGPIERTLADLAVVGVFEDDRPLRGEAGRIDWRLCGRLSSLLAGGTLSAQRGAAALVQSSGGLATPFVMALGLGAREAFDVRAGASFVREAVSRSVDLAVASVALGLPGTARTDLAARLEGALRGAVSAMADRPAELQIRLVAAPAERSAAADLLPVLARRVPARGLALRLGSERLPISATGSPRGSALAASPPPSVK